LICNCQSVRHRREREERGSQSHRQREGVPGERHPLWSGVAEACLNASDWQLFKRWNSIASGLSELPRFVIYRLSLAYSD